MNLEEYETDLREEILRISDAEGAFQEDAFFGLAADIVTASGETEVLDRCLYRGSTGSGIRVDGRGADPLASGVLDLAVVEFQS